MSRTARQAIGYRELLSHLEEGVPLEQAKAESLRRLRAFARRQEAWFRRDPRVIWIRADRSDLVEAVQRPSRRHRRQRRGRATLMSVLTLVKYQGLGNDFLVAARRRGARRRGREQASRPAGHSPDARRSGHVGELARALCDRHTGVGADGLLVLRTAVSGGDVRMELRNADGGRAETSGNGLRCFALAAIEAGLVSGPEVAIETDAGMRRAAVACAEERARLGRRLRRDGARSRSCPAPSPSPKPALPGLERRCRGRPGPSMPAIPISSCSRPRLGGRRHRSDRPELERIGAPAARTSRSSPTSRPRRMISLVVWERGAGATLACGSGSVAAAAALALAQGSRRRSVRVHNPGGTAEVSLAGDDPLAVLATLAGPGPARRPNRGRPAESARVGSRIVVAS